METIQNIWPALTLLIVLCIPALIWLFRWFCTSHYALKEGKNLSSLKCESCDSKGSCASRTEKPQNSEKQSFAAQNSETQILAAKCPAMEGILTKFPELPAKHSPKTTHGSSKIPSSSPSSSPAQ